MPAKVSRHWDHHVVEETRNYKNRMNSFMSDFIIPPSKKTVRTKHLEIVRQILDKYDCKYERDLHLFIYGCLEIAYDRFEREQFGSEIRCL